VWLLVDQSASSAAAHGHDGHSMLHAAALSAAATARALERLGVACAVSGFSSNGRHAVELQAVKQLGERVESDALCARLRGLRTGGSTRLGAALRHAAARMNNCAAGRRVGAKWVLLLSDAEAHDIDVHDPRYLVEDARHAVRSAARRGVRMACLALTADTSGDARRIFGPRGVHAVSTLRALPGTVQRLLG
jgi:nitric oxide reductase activation protein